MSYRSPQDILEESVRKNRMETQNKEAVINSVSKNTKFGILSDLMIYATYIIGSFSTNLLLNDSGLIIIICIIMNIFISMFFLIKYFANMLLFPINGLYVYMQQIGAMNSGKLSQSDSENVKSDFCASVTTRMPSDLIYSEAISRIALSVAWGGVWRVGVILFPWLIAFGLRPPA